MKAALKDKDKIKDKSKDNDDGGSRERMIEATGLLLRRQGYAATGMSEIVTAAAAPRGSIYFHFPGGKEELAAAALERAAERWRVAIDALLAEASDPALALALVIDALGAELQASGFKDGCPLATVALETAGSGGALATVCEVAFDGWRAVIEKHLQQAGYTQAEAAALAWLVLASIEGALLLARVRGDLEPLQTVSKQLQTLLSSSLR